MKKINEIFYSLQGEGFHVGTPAVFVRFSGCNLKCEFCDTRHKEGVMMSDEEILEQVCQYPCKTVILTGKYVCIETNGTCVLPESIDWVTCSPKLGASLRVRRMDEVKVVFLGQDVSPYLQLKASSYFLQTCSCRNTAEVIEYIKSHPQWRLSLQIHKLIDIP